jgi:hypothetical protein
LVITWHWRPSGWRGGLLVAIAVIALLIWAILFSILFAVLAALVAALVFAVLAVVAWKVGRARFSRRNCFREYTKLRGAHDTRVDRLAVRIVSVRRRNGRRGSDTELHDAGAERRQGGIRGGHLLGTRRTVPRPARTRSGNRSVARSVSA